jgi:hypothetical protein
MEMTSTIDTMGNIHPLIKTESNVISKFSERNKHRKFDLLKYGRS